MLLCPGDAVITQKLTFHKLLFQREEEPHNTDERERKRDCVCVRERESEQERLDLIVNN